MYSITNYLFQNLADNLSVGISIFELISREDMDFKFTYANKKLDEIVGVIHEPLIGMNTRSLFAAAYEGSATLPVSMMKALDTQQEVPMGLQTYVDGQFGAHAFDVTCFYLQENHVAFITKASINIESLTQELSIQKQMLEEGEKAAGLSSWIVDGKTGDTKYTKAFLHIHHFKGEEVTAKTATAASIARIHPDDQEKMEKFRTTLHALYPVAASYRYLLADQSYVWLEDTISQRMPDGTLMGITKDITERKKKEHQLQKALHFQEKIMSTSPEIIYVYDLHKRQNVFANKSLFAEIGYTDEEVQKMGDQLFVKTIHPDDLERVFHHHGHILPNIGPGQVVKLEYRMLNKQTQTYIWLESTESIFELDEQGNVHTIIGLARNIHTQKQAESEILKVNKELEQFVYSVSHDLRAPVRHIESYAAYIQEEESLTEAGKKYLGRVSFAARRLGGMIDDLLKYSRTRNANPVLSVIHPHQIVTQILSEFSEANPQLTIQWEVQDLPPCMADPNMLTQVWENLISNAIKYSSKKEKIQIKIEAQEEQLEIIYAIHDKGCGFKQKYASKLFAVFQRLHKHSEFPGHGIGLANVQRMIQKHKGRIWGESVVGEGASFYFSIPKRNQNG